MSFYTVLLTLALIIAPAAGFGPSQAPAGPSRPQLRVLFVGNSYTYYNNLPALVGQVSGGALETAICGTGGATLQMHLQNPDCRTLLDGRRWDVVVLQEQSLLGGTTVDGRPTVGDPARVFFPGVTAWMGELRSRGARPALFLTWARRDVPEMQAALTAAYTKAGAEHGALVVPVGPAWQRFRAAHPDLPLHIEDGSHPTAAGSYLAAAVFATVLLDREVKVPNGSIEVNPAPDGKVDLSTRQRVDVPAAVRQQAHAVAAVVWRESKKAAPVGK